MIDYMVLVHAIDNNATGFESVDRALIQLPRTQKISLSNRRALRALLSQRSEASQNVI